MSYTDLQVLEINQAFSNTRHDQPCLPERRERVAAVVAPPLACWVGQFALLRRTLWCLVSLDSSLHLTEESSFYFGGAVQQ